LRALLEAKRASRMIKRASPTYVSRRRRTSVAATPARQSELVTETLQGCHADAEGVSWGEGTSATEPPISVTTPYRSDLDPQTESLKESFQELPLAEGASRPLDGDTRRLAHLGNDDVKQMFDMKANKIPETDDEVREFFAGVLG